MDYIQPKQTASLTPELHYDDIIIGGTLQSLEAARITGFPIFSTDPRPPLPFDEDCSTYEHTGFLLSLLGNGPTSGISRITDTKDGALVLHGKSRIVATITYERAHVFNAADVLDVIDSSNIEREIEEKNIVIDWFVTKSKQKVLHSLLHTTIDEDNDVAHIVKIYDTSAWYRKNKMRKKAVAAISLLTEEETQSMEFDVSPQLIMFKAMDMLHEPPIELKWKGRDVHPMNQTICKDHGKFTFYSSDMSLKDVRHRFMPLHSRENLLAFEKLAAVFGASDINEVFAEAGKRPARIAAMLDSNLARYVYEAYRRFGKKGLYMPSAVMAGYSNWKLKRLEDTVDNFIRYYNGDD